jgi:hypothetical protein
VTTRIESFGSIWEIDEDDLRYRRFPKWEGPREKMEWGTTEGPLKDFEWHPYSEWRIIERHEMQFIVIVTGENANGEPTGVRAPLGFVL